MCIEPYIAFTKKKKKKKEEPHVDVSVLVTLEQYPCFSYTQIKEPHVSVLVTLW